jgi:hypothetical protein
MNKFSIYKTIYFIGVVLIIVGGYRLFKQLPYGEILFSTGIILYAVVQIFMLFYKEFADWKIFEYLKLSVNILFLASVALLLLFDTTSWYYPFILGLLLDFFANIFRRMKRV